MPQQDLQKELDDAYSAFSSARDAGDDDSAKRFAQYAKDIEGRIANAESPKDTYGFPALYDDHLREDDPGYKDQRISNRDYESNKEELKKVQRDLGSAKRLGLDDDVSRFEAAVGALESRDSYYAKFLGIEDSGPALSDAERRQKIVKLDYERDQAIADTPDQITQSELQEFRSKHFDSDAPGGGVLGAENLRREVVKDPFTGEVRWAALSPKRMAKIDDADSGTEVALKSGFTRWTGERIEDVDATIDRRRRTQKAIFQQLSSAEQDRVRARLKEKYPSKSIEQTPSYAFRKAMEENPDNERILDDISGDEWGAERSDFWKRVGNRLTGGRALGANIFGADDPQGDIIGPGRYRGLEYEDDEQAPLYAGASADIREWKSDSKYEGGGIYEYLIRPFFTKDGVLPGARVKEAAEMMKKEGYSEEDLASVGKRFFPEGKGLKDIFTAEMWTDPNTKLPWNDWDGFYLTLMENAPQIGVGIVASRIGGAFGAREGVRMSVGKTLAQMEKTRRFSAGVGGVIAGGATEGILIHDNVASEIRDSLNEVSMEKFEKDEKFQQLLGAGLTPEEAKQVLIDETARFGGNAAFVFAGIMAGAPMQWFFGQAAAGRIGGRTTGRQIATGFLGEPIQEGTQEVIEGEVSDIAIATIDPENPIFDDVGRRLERFAGGFFVSAPTAVGALGAISPSKPVGVDKKDQEVIQQTGAYLKATNRRYAFEIKISNPEYIKNTDPAKRLEDMQFLEMMQKEEAELLLKAEPAMRAHMEQESSLTSASELKLLNALKMRANSVLTDIAVARSRRQTVGEMVEEQQQILKERNRIQHDVTASIMKLDDVQRLAKNIEAVQNQEALSEEDYEELAKAGYGRWIGPNKDQFVIKPKGKRALNLLMQQSKSLTTKLDSGYTGADRRKPENIMRRDLVDSAGPVEREQMILQDTLTGMQNRRAFEERGQDAPAVAAVDVDSLAWINDNMGHATGDRLLMTVADAIEKQKGVEVFRLGGDEFAVTASSQEALETALQAAKAELDITPLVVGEEQVTPQITWGKGATYDEADAQTADMKQERIQRGVVAGRKKKAATFSVRTQLPLFHRIKVKGSEIRDKYNIDGNSTFVVTHSDGDVYFYRFAIDREGNLLLMKKFSSEGYTEGVDVSGMSGQSPMAIIKRTSKDEDAEFHGRSQEIFETSMDKVGAFFENRSRKLPDAKIKPEDIEPWKKGTLPEVKEGEAIRTRNVTEMMLDMLRESRDVNPQSIAWKNFVRDVRNNERQREQQQQSDKSAEQVIAEAKQKRIDVAVGDAKLRISSRFLNAFNSVTTDMGYRERAGTMYVSKQYAADLLQSISKTVRRPRLSDMANYISQNYDPLTTQYLSNIYNNNDKAGRGINISRLNQIIEAHDILNTTDGRLLLMKDDEPALATTWKAVRTFLERGDTVELLTPDGAVTGLVSKIKTAHNRPRVTVVIEGREFTFNPVRNHLITHHSDPADIAWITGNAVYVQPDSGTRMPQVITGVRIGHIGFEGTWYADLGGLTVKKGRQRELPWYFDEYPEWSAAAPYVYKLPEASDEDMERAEAIKLKITANYKNLPPITLVRSIDELEKINPELVQKLKDHPGASLSSVRGFFDEDVPENGVVIMVQNTPKYNDSFEANLTETLFHEIIGHYGVRGVFGNEIDLREEMHAIVKAFPKIAAMTRGKVPRLVGTNDDQYQQVVGEEMIAYITGEMMAGTIELTPPQRNAIQRFFDYVRAWFTRHGWDRHFPDAKSADTKYGFWNDERVQSLIARSQDFVRNGHGWSFDYFDGRHTSLMRDADIFQLGTIDAMNNATKTLSNRQRRALESKYPSFQSVPKVVPIFPEIGSPNIFKIAIDEAKKQGYMSKKELELTNLLIGDSDVFSFFRDSTYQDIKTLDEGVMTNADTTTNDWYNRIMPIGLAQEYESLIEVAANPENYVRPDDRASILADAEQRIQEILSSTIHQKSSSLTKDHLLKYLQSDKVVSVTIVPARGHPTLTYEEAAARILGPNYIPENVTDDEQQMIRDEIAITSERGFDIGFDEDMAIWFDRLHRRAQYSDSVPQGANYANDYRVVFVKQQGKGLATGSIGHFGHDEGVLIHIRTGLAEVFPLEGQVMPIAMREGMEGKLLSLIEQQGDWLQRLRKRYKSVEDQRSGEARKRVIAMTIRSVNKEMVKTMASHVQMTMDKLLTPIANLPTGSLRAEFENYIRDSRGITDMEGALTEEQREESYRSFRNTKLQGIVSSLESARESLRNMAAERMPLEGALGSLDARMFDLLDKHVMQKVAYRLRIDLERLIAKVIDLENTTTQARFVQYINDNLYRDLLSSVYGGMREGLDNGSDMRLPVATVELKRMLLPFYEALGIDNPEGTVDGMIDKMSSRKRVVYKIPMERMQDYSNVMEVGGAESSSLAMVVQGFFTDSRLLDNGIDPNSLSIVTTASPSNTSIDIEVIGSLDSLESFDEKLKTIIDSFFNVEQLSETRSTMIREKKTNLRRARERRDQPERQESNWENIDWDEIVSQWDWEVHDVEGETTTEMSDQGVVGYDEWSDGRFENEMDNWINYEVETMEWSEIQNEEGETLDEDSEAYRERVVEPEEEDGEENTQAADDWLRVERDQYAIDLRLTEYARESVDEKLREQWSDDPAYLTTGDVPIEWDEDGDAIDTVPFVLRKQEQGDSVEMRIDDNHMDTWSYESAAEPNTAEQVNNFYVNNNITPPAGTLFGPDAPPDAREPEALSMEEERLAALTEPNWDIVKTGIQDNITPFADKEGESTAKMFNELVILSKRSGTDIDTPLKKDEYWRNMSLKYLLADAVRRGLSGVIWNPGLATNARGGAGFDGITTDRINWSVESIDIRGEPQEVWVISSPEMSRPIAVSRQFSVPILGGDVVGYINQQIAGELPLSSVKTDEAGDPTDEQVTADDYLISRVEGTEHVAIHDRFTGDFLQFRPDEEAAQEWISEAVERRNAQRRASSTITSPTQSGSETAESLGEAVMQGQVSKEDMGGSIRIISGFSMHSYSHSAGMPTLGGARESYEGINPRHWNKTLKEFGVKIGEIYIKATNPRRAEEREGARIKTGTARTEQVAADHITLGVHELTGDRHGWVMVSETEGVIQDQIFDSKAQAERMLSSYIQDRYGDEDGGIKVAYIPINAAIREKFSGPVPPFHYDPRQDPKLKSAAEKVGYEGASLREKLRAWKGLWQDHFIQGVFDRFYGIKRALKQAGIMRSAAGDAYIQTRLTTSLDSMMKAVLNYGHPVWKEGIMQTEGRGLLDILQPVMADVELWGMYMAGVRAKRLMTEGREHLWTEEEIDAMVKLGDAYPSFKRVAANYANFNKKVLDFAQESGVINKDTRALWENADYVPFYRVQDERLVGPLSGGAGIANQKQPIKRLKGGEANVGDIMHNIFTNLTKLIDTSVKNHAALLAVDALSGSGIISKKPMTHSQELIPLQQVRKLLMDRGMNPDTIPTEALTGFQKMFAVQPPSGPGVISVLRNGKKEFYYTDDELLYRAMTNINKKAWGRWMSLFRAPKRLLTTLVTLDPGFMIANFIRDSMSAFVLSRDKYIPIAGAIKGFGQALVKDKAMRTMLSAGAAFESGYINQYDPQATHRLIKNAMKNPSFSRTILNSPKKLFEAWKAIGSASENANRIAIYNAAIRAGKSKARAVFEAKDIMDFSMGGDWPFIQFLIQTVPFMGARMQGLHRLGRGFAENPTAFAMKGSLIGMAGLALWFAFKDDERYKELEEWDKDVYFHFWIGDNHYRLPKGFEVGAIFNTIPERTFEYMYSEENDAGKLLMKRWGFMLGETFNFNPVPQTFKPMLESYFNYNFFTGRQIVSPYEQDRMAPEEYRHHTSPSMIELARSLPGGLDTVSGKIRSPLHLENLFRGYTATLGRYFMMASDALVRSQMNYPLQPEWRTGDYPVTGRFIRGDEPRRTKYEEEVYGLIRKTAEIQGSLRYLERTQQEVRFEDIQTEFEPYIRVAKDLESVRSEISEINKAIMHIYTDDRIDEDTGEYRKTPQMKRKEIDELQEEKNRLFRIGHSLRPGGEENPDVPITQEQIIDLMDNFGVDDNASSRLEDTNPETFELANSVLEMTNKNLESLARQ